MKDIDIPKSFHFIKEKHEKFIANICKNETVYTLNSEDGYAFSETFFIDDDNGDVFDKILFWSTIEAAELCQTGEWADHDIEIIDLASFLELWCISIKNDNLIIGTDSTADMVSYEIDPLDLIIEIIDNLKQNKPKFVLNKFEDIFDLEQQVKRVLED